MLLEPVLRNVLEPTLGLLVPTALAMVADKILIPLLLVLPLLGLLLLLLLLVRMDC